MSVTPLEDGAFGVWDDFVRDHPKSTAFHLSAWHRSLKAGMGHEVFWLTYRSRAGALEGVLPLTRVKSRLFGHSIISSAFAVYGGPVYENDGAKQALLEAAKSLVLDSGASALELRSCEPEVPQWPSKSDMYVTFRRAIDADPDVNMKAIPRKQRAMVRKAIKKDLHAKISGSVDHHFAIYAESVRNLGTPVFPKKWFQALQHFYGDEADILIIKKDDKSLASVMSLYFRGEVLPYYGGGTAGARAFAANDYMYWALMEHARNKGCTSFDFGRSKVGTGAFSFKKNWGFEPTPLHYEFFLPEGSDMPDVNPLNPKYQLMIRTWKKLPLWLANRMGPLISKNLG
ncbi:MAG: FemAB family XrtA/PEP-CTERM system-associated protein [Pseudomonadota bacterium]